MTTAVVPESRGREATVGEGLEEVGDAEQQPRADETLETSEGGLRSGLGMAMRGGEHEEDPLVPEETAEQETGSVLKEQYAMAGDAAGAAAPDRAAPLTTSVRVDELRSLVLRAYPEALPELVQGETLEALLASAERAVELRQRLLAEVSAGIPVAAGAPRRVELGEGTHLSPLEKIVRAIAGRGG